MGWLKTPDLVKVGFEMGYGSWEFEQDGFRMTCKRDEHRLRCFMG